MTAPESVFTLPPEKEAQRAELMRRLCGLQGHVNEVVFGYGQSADCICLSPREGETPVPTGWTWSNSGKVIDFIVEAVQQKLATCLDAQTMAAEQLRTALAEIAVQAGVTAEHLEAAR